MQPRDMRDKAQLDMLRETFGKLRKRGLFIEVGGWKGELSRVMAEIFEHVIVIDCWPKDPITETAESVSVRRVFLENIAPHKNISLLSMDGLAAASLFANGCADCVYIDDLHDYDAMVKRLEVWPLIIAHGGTAAGHDYSEKFPGVKRAVNERFGRPFVTGLSDTSWMVSR